MTARPNAPTSYSVHPDSAAGRAIAAFLQGPCPICLGVEGCDHTVAERLAEAFRIATSAEGAPAGTPHSVYLVMRHGSPEQAHFMKSAAMVACVGPGDFVRSVPIRTRPQPAPSPSPADDVTPHKEALGRLVRHRVLARHGFGVSPAEDASAWDEAEELVRVEP